MNENNIKYLGYGADLQVPELQLIEYLSDNVNNYVNDKPWTNKRKQYFMEAYLDMLNKGLIRAIPKDGIWSIEINGDDLDLSSMPEKKADMYHQVAYFIRTSMKRLAEDSIKEQEKKKSAAVQFSNDLFLNDFNKHISFNILGGQPFIIGGENDRWNYRDEINPIKGERDTKNRKKLLSQLLKSYSDSLNENSYNFDNSPFENINDFKSKINDAINALDTEDLSDDEDALNAIGLRYSDWFNNGSGEFSGRYDESGNPLTNRDYYNALLRTADSLVNSFSYALFNKNKKENNIDKATNEALDIIRNLNDKTSFKLTDKLDSSDIPLAISAAGDIASLFGGWSNVGGTAASIIGDTTYDIMKGQVGWGTLLNIGTNLGLGVAGLIPGLKNSLKGEKALAKTAMIFGKIGNVIRAGNLMFANREGVLSLLDKLAHGRITDLSSDDVANARDLIGLITGTIRVRQASNRMKAHDRYVSKQKFKVGDEEVVLSDELVRLINRVGATKGKDAAKKLYKDYTGKDMPDELANKFPDNNEGMFNSIKLYIRSNNPVNNSNIARSFTGKNIKGELFIDEEGIQNLLKTGYRNLGNNESNRFMDYVVYPTGGKRTVGRMYGVKKTALNNPPVTENNPDIETSKNEIQFKTDPDLNSNKSMLTFDKSQPSNAQALHLFRQLKSGKTVSTVKPKTGEHYFGNQKIQVDKTVDSKGKTKYSIFSENIDKKNLSETKLRKQMFDIIQTIRRLYNMKPQDFGNGLIILKDNGLLKQGGKINKYTIKNFLK